VTASAGRGEAEHLLEFRRGRIRVPDRDDQVVDPEQHPRSVRVARARRRPPALNRPPAHHNLPGDRSRRAAQDGVPFGP
jgi:hypothetical protein